MLLSFRVANHRSIRDEQELSLVATELNERTGRDTGVRSEGKQVSCLPAVGIFGANASGKSNLLSAMRFMRKAVRESFAEWDKDGGVPREPFTLADEAREETSLFEVDLLLGSRGKRVRYTYGFELSDERVEAEWLHAYPSGRKQEWFDRDAGRPADGGDEFVFRGSGLRGPKESYVALTRPNSLFLTVAAAMNHPQLTAVHRWFRDNLWLVTAGQDVEARTRWARNLLMHTADDDMRKRFVTLLRVADLGITDVSVDADTGDPQLLHRASDGRDKPLDFWKQESLGTHAWFAFLGPLLHVLDQGGTLLADELDSSLHPLLAAEVIRLFQDRESNPRTAQLIFTTHDATLLGPSVAERPLDRDQVWITLKSGTGETELYPLTAARKIRNDENLERRYLHGHYGGIPRITTGEVARQLALVEEGRKATA
ncbi:ATP-binding protein [Streptomyces sp. ICN441]|uniref:ATP-binding protein n=1 Tax=Streptomyces tirandamycinicus TaxID=2174846 RepID=A0A2S1SXD2_9ACTN|nr:MULTISPECIES: ATP-binding protein [Streptomyces]AWI31074.1 ATP-binding protein [Streptomyces tirandamycinicus]TFE58482.1 ATP-binding protein [Streptomyces sp. ICN441]